jgi:hypothetical protein
MNIKPKKYQKHWFQFLSRLVQDAINRHPKNVDLRLVNSFIHRVKLKN